MNLQELIDFHTVGAEACEAYAATPSAADDKNKDIAKHYRKRAVWHRDAIALVQPAPYNEARELAACRAVWEKNKGCLFSDMWIGWKARARSAE